MVEKRKQEWTIHIPHKQHLNRSNTIRRILSKEQWENKDSDKIWTSMKKREATTDNDKNLDTINLSKEQRFHNDKSTIKATTNKKIFNFEINFMSIRIMMHILLESKLHWKSRGWFDCKDKINEPNRSIIFNLSGGCCHYFCFFLAIRNRIFKIVVQYSRSSIIFCGLNFFFLCNSLLFQLTH